MAVGDIVRVGEVLFCEAAQRMDNGDEGEDQCNEIAGCQNGGHQEIHNPEKPLHLLPGKERSHKGREAHQGIAHRHQERGPVPPACLKDAPEVAEDEHRAKIGRGHEEHEPQLQDSIRVRGLEQHRYQKEVGKRAKNQCPPTRQGPLLAGTHHRHHGTDGKINRERQTQQKLW